MVTATTMNLAAQLEPIAARWIWQFAYCANRKPSWKSCVQRRRNNE